MNKKKNPKRGVSTPVAQSMGIPKIWQQPFTVILRKFRWLFESPVLESNWVTNLTVDYLAKTIKFSVYNIIQPDGRLNAQEFREAMLYSPTMEILTIYDVDGCGNRVSKQTFTPEKVLECKQTYDYNSSDIQTIDFVIQFSFVKTESITGACTSKSHSQLRDKVKTQKPISESN